MAMATARHVLHHHVVDTQRGRGRRRRRRRGKRQRQRHVVFIVLVVVRQGVGDGRWWRCVVFVVVASSTVRGRGRTRRQRQGQRLHRCRVLPRSSRSCVVDPHWRPGRRQGGRPRRRVIVRWETADETDGGAAATE